MSAYISPTEAQAKVVEENRRLAAKSMERKAIAGFVAFTVVVAWIYVFWNGVATHREEQRDHRREVEQKMYH